MQFSNSQITSYYHFNNLFCNMYVIHYYRECSFAEINIINLSLTNLSSAYFLVNVDVAFARPLGVSL